MTKMKTAKLTAMLAAMILELPQAWGASSPGKDSIAQPDLAREMSQISGAVSNSLKGVQGARVAGDIILPPAPAAPVVRRLTQDQMQKLIQLATKAYQIKGADGIYIDAPSKPPVRHLLTPTGEDTPSGLRLSSVELAQINFCWSNGGGSGIWGVSIKPGWVPCGKDYVFSVDTDGTLSLVSPKQGWLSKHLGHSAPAITDAAVQKALQEEIKFWMDYEPKS